MDGIVKEEGVGKGGRGGGGRYLKVPKYSIYLATSINKMVLVASVRFKNAPKWHRLESKISFLEASLQVTLPVTLNTRFRIEPRLLPRNNS